MSNTIRIYSLAREVGLSSKEVLAALREIGIEKKSHSSTVTLEEAERLRAAARKGGVKLRVDDEALFFEPHLKLKELIGAMEIGEICAARFRSNIVGAGGWGPSLKRNSTRYV